MARLTPENVARAEAAIRRYPRKRSALIPLLHIAQEQEGWISEDAMCHVAELLDLTPAEVLATASFYGMFKLQPVGRYVLNVCTNISCMLLGGYELLEHLENRLGVRAGGTTTDGMFTVEDAECLAACGGAPCLQVNYRYFEHVTPEAADRLLDELRTGQGDHDIPPHGTLCRVPLPEPRTAVTSQPGTLSYQGGSG